MFAIQSDDFDEFCFIDNFSDNENFQMLQYQPQGCKLFNDNSDSVNNYLNYLQNRIVEKTDIVSDLFDNKEIKILTIDMGENDYKMIYEIPTMKVFRYW